MPSPSIVVFVCLHGSAKSVIASARVVQGLLADGFDVRGQRPRLIARADLERASHVQMLVAQ